MQTTRKDNYLPGHPATSAHSTKTKKSGKTQEP